MSNFGIAWAAIKGFCNPFSSVFEAVIDYVLDGLNTFLTSESVAGKVAKGYSVARMVLDTFDKYADWCPQKWRPQFDSIRSVVSEIVGVFADGKVTREELDKVTEKYQVEYAKWYAD